MKEENLLCSMLSVTFAAADATLGALGEVGAGARLRTASVDGISPTAGAIDFADVAADIASGDSGAPNVAFGLAGGVSREPAVAPADEGYGVSGVVDGAEGDEIPIGAAGDDERTGGATGLAFELGAIVGRG
jgi:hypothetical protein